MSVDVVSDVEENGREDARGYGREQTIGRERERERREGEEGDKNNERHNEEEEQTRRGT